VIPPTLGVGFGAFVAIFLLAISSCSIEGIIFTAPVLLATSIYTIELVGVPNDMIVKYKTNPTTPPRSHDLDIKVSSARAT
jgi:hypothetical protein